MIYTAHCYIDVNANQSYDTEPEYIWIDINHLSDATHVCAVRVGAGDDIAVEINQPTAAELAFVRDVVQMSELLRRKP
jgi:hypothetical protein